MEQPRADINVSYPDSLQFLHSRKNCFVLIFYKILISFTTILTLLFFLLQKNFYIAHKHIGVFCPFFLQEDFGTFHVLLFETFLSFFIIVICHFYIYRKKTKKYFISFVYSLKNNFMI